MLKVDRTEPKITKAFASVWNSSMLTASMINGKFNPVPFPDQCPWSCLLGLWLFKEIKICRCKSQNLWVCLTLVPIQWFAFSTKCAWAKDNNKIKNIYLHLQFFKNVDNTFVDILYNNKASKRLKPFIIFISTLHSYPTFNISGCWSH